MRKRFFLIGMVLIIVQGTAAQQTGYAPSGEADIFYRIFGSGKPLLIVNGGPGFGSEGFVDLATRLAEKYQIILFDQRGTGGSFLEEINSNNIRMDLMIKDMEALREHLGLQQWSVLGHSFGGMLANYYTARYPERVIKLILSASGGLDLEILQYFNFTSQLTKAEQDSFAYWNTRVSQGEGSSYARHRQREFMAAAYLYRDDYIPKIADRLAQGNAQITQLVWNDMRRIQFDVSAELARFNRPVLIIQGKQDLIRERTAVKAYNVFPNADLVLLENCGHFGWLDRPDAYFTTIFSFLDESSGS